MKLAMRIDRRTILDNAGAVTPAKARLAAAGEKLFGERGIDTIPLHEIATEAGQANKYAVQYHFEGRDGLIRAIFSLRIGAIEARQRELVGEAERRALLDDIGGLLELMFLPIAEQVDDDGRHSYARFLLQFITRPNFDHSLHHPLGARDDPVGFVFDRLMAMLGLSRDRVMRGMYLSTLIFLGALIERDNALQFDRPLAGLEETLTETFGMMAAAIQAMS